jgi:hypothetical protein
MWKLLPVYGVCALVLSGCNPFEDKMIALCENELKDRLIAPITYSRASAEFSRTSIPIPEYKEILIARSQGKNATYSKLTLDINMRDLNERAEDIKAGKYPSPTRFSVLFKYDAQNGFGAMIRGESLCEYISSDDSSSRAAYYNVKVDGFDHSEFLLNGIKNAQE